MIASTIFDFIKTEESAFQTNEVQVGDNWTWNFRNHVQLIFHLKNTQFYSGDNNWLRAFKNIMEPILNLAYWTEDIELKDVVFYIEEKAGRVLSFLLKKYHDEVYVKENNLDTLFDEITESDLDYGGVLVQKTDQAKPEVFDLNSVAFCDQTDILAGPIAFKHNFSPDKLREMAKLGWGEKKNGATISLEDLIILAEPEKTPVGQSRQNRLTGKNIEVYIVRGSLPEDYLKDNGDMEYHCHQIQIVAFYTPKQGTKQGVILYRQKEDGENLKFHTSKKVYGRALGRGIGETLLHPQIWTNFLEIHKMNLLESASKIPLYTDDSNYQNRNRIQDMENLEITTIEEGKVIRQVPTAAPANIGVLEQSIREWYEQAQLEGSAFDPLLGRIPPGRTTFRGQERAVAQGRGSHDRRRGQRAKFIEEIYRDWIIPDIKKNILKGKTFLASLSSEDLSWIADRLADNYAFEHQKNSVLNLESPQEKEAIKQEFLKNFSKKGNRHLLEILKDEFKGIEIKIGIDISSKQKDLMGLHDKIFSIFQQIFANPQAFQQVMQIPAMSRAFSDVLEYLGLSATEFNFNAMQIPQTPLQTALPQTQAMPAQPQVPQAPLAQAI